MATETFGSKDAPRVGPRPEVPRERRGFGWYLSGRVITIEFIDGQKKVLALTDKPLAFFTKDAVLIVHGTWTPAEAPKTWEFPLINVRWYYTETNELYRDFPVVK